MLGPVLNTDNAEFYVYLAATYIDNDKAITNMCTILYW